MEDCNLPSGIVFTMTPNQIGVSKIVLEKGQRKCIFTGDDVPTIYSKFD